MEFKLEDYSSIEESPESMGAVFEELEKNPLVSRITIYGKTIKSYSIKDVLKLREYLSIFSTIRVSLERAVSNCSCSYEIPFKEAYTHPLKFLLFLESQHKKPSCKCSEYKMAIRNAFLQLKSTKFLHPLYLKKEKLRELGRDIYTLSLNPYERSRVSKTLFSSYSEGEIVSSYVLEDGSEVNIYSKDGISYLYHLKPSEFLLSIDEEYLVLDVIRDVEKRVDLLTQDDVRKIAREIIRQSLIKRVKSTPNVSAESIPKLVHIALRNTVGYGVIDILLLDDEIQDIYINRDEEPLYITHNSYEEAITNIIPVNSNILEWATKIKLENNKPLDESHPLLDGNISNEKALVRASVMHPPLNTKGISFSIRRHREVPITLPLLVKNNALPSKAAAYLSIVSLFGRSMLIAGSRGSGKTTLLGALMFELPSKYRIVTIEDTLELPVGTLLNNKYNVISMKSKSFLSIAESDVEAQDALKASLRFGDSCLILGEARGKETIALYEAMRVGALSNFVGGTLHAESPYGVYDRVVNDLGVKRTSFKATDVIVILSLLKSPSALRRERKLVSITELKDNWQEDPLREKAFIPITTHESGSYSYNFSKSEVLEKIASTMPSKINKSYLQNLVNLKSKTIDYLIKLSQKDPNLLNPENVIKSNSLFLASISKKNPFEWWKRQISKRVV